ncbi:hypothetical protein [Paenibacillus sp. NAIST15-1]|uniref:hypothetical protein n=1 Tax=Paenibacillus sp. NAIST15-1 TaxID=1605994 RepID=UPI00086AB273|nr:hypothetical protein [Paenibacillus sp. NAIST15-1]GAV11410.1 ribonucleoside-diphosphate reductase class II [Paenibacillus sp. NAIST15-1]
MYNNMIVTSIYIEAPPVLTVSTNEPNKKQIVHLIGRIADKREIDGETKYISYEDLKNGDKLYKFTVGDKQVMVVVERLPILTFAKNSDEYTFDPVEIRS